MFANTVIQTGKGEKSYTTPGQVITPAPLL